MKIKCMTAPEWCAKYCVWHKKFAWLPKKSSDKAIIMWLEFVERKTEDYYSNLYGSPEHVKYVYTFPKVADWMYREITK